MIWDEVVDITLSQMNSVIFSLAVLIAKTTCRQARVFGGKP